MSTPISSDQLIETIYRDVFITAVEDSEAVFRNPPGRNPSEAARDMSDWYVGLSENDRERVHLALRKVADFAVFGMLCLLDNVRPVTDGFMQELRLSVEANGQRTDFDPADPLHEIFRARVDADSA